MRTIIAILLLIIISLPTQAQRKVKKKIKEFNDCVTAAEREGRILYRLELASWHGTDFIAERMDLELSGGYASYADGTNTTCVFFSKDDHPKVIATITFDSNFSKKEVKINFTERQPSEQELALYTIVKKTQKMIIDDLTNSKKPLFKLYENTRYNYIPLIYNNEKKVYILTASGKAGVIIFGNDYLISFDKQNEITDKKKLHKNIIRFKVTEAYKGKVTFHTHLPSTGPCFTSTDICTLLLYGKQSTWSGHNVIGSNFVSVWNFETESAEIIEK